MLLLLPGEGRCTSCTPADACQHSNQVARTHTHTVLETLKATQPMLCAQDVELLSSLLWAAAGGGHLTA